MNRHNHIVEDDRRAENEEREAEDPWAVKTIIFIEASSENGE